MGFPNDQTLLKVYGETVNSKRRLTNLKKLYEDTFKINGDALSYFTCSGRTEIIGNHTDHNGGKVIAGAVTMDSVGVAEKNNSDTITIVSEGYKKPFSLKLSKLQEVPKCKGTISLIAGLIVALQKAGYKVSGFYAAVQSSVIPAAGVSSSASFEMLVMTIINHLFNDDNMTYIDYAKCGQFAENVYWAKGSGLMDQLACSVGGPIVLDFSNEKELYHKIDFTFDQIGYDVVLVNTGKGHSDLSAEYSAVPSEMKEVAKLCGVEILAQTSLDTVLSHANEISNDRALLRAIHFFKENQRVEDMEKAMDQKNTKEILRLINESGKSSYELLQNCYCTKDTSDQKITRYLALINLFLEDIKDGACRVHGGGFAGVVMAVVPNAQTENFIQYMQQFVSQDALYKLNVRAVGAGYLA